MRKVLSLIALSVVSICFLNQNVGAHCEIPCGIYDDRTQITLIREDITTIEKSMDQIIELQEKEKPDFNQLTRWIMNKENHADKIQKSISQYFMTQRISPDTANYQKKIGLLHQMLIYAMKCKQTTDLKNVDSLRDLVDQFESLYFDKKTHAH
jgi:nickel superoxide dismutase